MACNRFQHWASLNRLYSKQFSEHVIGSYHSGHPPSFDGKLQWWNVCDSIIAYTNYHGVLTCVSFGTVDQLCYTEVWIYTDKVSLRKKLKCADMDTSEVNHTTQVLERELYDSLHLWLQALHSFMVNPYHLVQLSVTVRMKFNSQLYLGTMKHVLVPSWSSNN